MHRHDDRTEIPRNIQRSILSCGSGPFGDGGEFGTFATNPLDAMDGTEKRLPGAQSYQDFPEQPDEAQNHSARA
jgi:hypothetical protein